MYTYICYELEIALRVHQCTRLEVEVTQHYATDPRIVKSWYDHERERTKTAVYVNSAGQRSCLSSYGPQESEGQATCIISNYFVLDRIYIYTRTHINTLRF